MKILSHMLKAVNIILFLAVFLSVNAGNPDGEYKIYVVDQNHPKADDAGPGTFRKPFLTINAAAGQAGPGDTVLVYSGIYRERVSPERSGEENRPVVYMAAENQSVIIRGSDILNSQWKVTNPEHNVYSTELSPSLFKGENPFAVKAASHKGERTLGQVFVNGRWYSEVDNEESLRLTPETWMTIDGKELRVHFGRTITDPAAQIIEITTRNRVFAPHKRGLSYITVRGFTIEHCANQFPSSFWVSDRNRGNPQGGALSTRSGHHWLIEYNTIRLANTIGIDCGEEGGYDVEGDQPTPEKTGYHIIRYNTISDNGAAGIVGADSPFTKISYNLIERNNAQGWTSPEVGGIKVHWFTDGIIEGNIVRDNDGHGIWLDNGCTDSRVTRNVVVNSRGTGIFTELADGPVLIDNNVVAFTRVGDGIYSHDCSGMTFVNNLLYGNEHFGIFVRVVTDRRTRTPEGERKLVGAHDITILNNIFVDNYRGNMSLPMESERVYNNFSDHNLFINGAQWHWEGLLNTRFVLNMANGRQNEEGKIISEDSGNISGRTIIAENLKKKLLEQNIPEDEMPNFRIWIREPYLTLEWWQMLTGFDKNSAAPGLGNAVIENGAVSKGMVNFSTVELYFETRESDPFGLVEGVPVPGMDKDFYGRSYDELDKILPGPFQEYSEGHNRFVLRPPVLKDR